MMVSNPLIDIYFDRLNFSPRSACAAVQVAVLTLCQWIQRPERYGRSVRLDTMPSMPWASAAFSRATGSLNVSASWMSSEPPMSFVRASLRFASENRRRSLPLRNRRSKAMTFTCPRRMAAGQFGPVGGWMGEEGGCTGYAARARIWCCNSRAQVLKTASRSASFSASDRSSF